VDGRPEAAIGINRGLTVIDGKAGGIARVKEMDALPRYFPGQYLFPENARANAEASIGIRAA
jgi:hypothetical protein